MQVHTNEESREKQPGMKPRPNWAKTGPGQSAQPVPGLVWALFDLATIQTIYRHRVKSHTSIHSSSAAEEQRSLRDTISERRVVLVV
jgi:hypothetical protein